MDLSGLTDAELTVLVAAIDTMVTDIRELEDAYRPENYPDADDPHEAAEHHRAVDAAFFEQLKDTVSARPTALAADQAAAVIEVLGNHVEFQRDTRKGLNLADPNMQRRAEETYRETDAANALSDRLLRDSHTRWLVALPEIDHAAERLDAVAAEAALALRDGCAVSVSPEETVDTLRAVAASLDTDASSRIATSLRALADRIEGTNGP